MENLSFKVAEIEISYRPAFKMAELPFPFCVAVDG
jgi:DNA repair protein RadC